MTCVLLIAFFQGECARAEYTLALLAGILLCFGGDMALMFMNRSKKAFQRGPGPLSPGDVAISPSPGSAGFHASDWISGAVLFLLGIAVYAYHCSRGWVI